MRNDVTVRRDYRADIDGLRAIAVLLIVLFHVDKSWAPGGFIGVDMFFVISGFLITGNIMRDHDAGRFSFGEFYRRRIRRIFPAMFVAVGGTLVTGMVLLLPADVSKLSWSAVATALSAANIHFTYFSDTGYFAASSDTIPLLHMWSLGVEEQFYLIWPALMLALLARKAFLLPVLVVIIVASVACGQWLLTHSEFDFAYYMLPPRMFQLGAGGLTAVLLRNSKAAGAWIERWPLLLALIGAVLIAGSTYYLNERSLFPGINSIPVTLGAALLLAAGSVSNPLSTALSFQPLRAIGLISYSLYLWHWPVLAFPRYFYHDLSLTQKASAIAAMLILATLSYLFVETPFRSNRRSFTQVFGRLFGLPALLLSIVACVLIVTRGFGPWMLTDYPTRLSAMPDIHSAAWSKTVCQRTALSDKLVSSPSCVQGNGEPTALLYGDSNAAHYIGFVGSLAAKAGFAFRNFEHSSCPPLLGDPTPFVDPRWLDKCRASLDLARKHIWNYEIVFLGATWQIYDDIGKSNGESLESELQGLVQTLTAKGTRVILLAKIPTIATFDHSCEKKRLKVPWVNCQLLGLSPQVQSSFNDALRRIAASNPKVAVLDPQAMFCDGTTCNAYQAGEPLYFDLRHLNFESSWRLGRKYAETAEGKRIATFVAEASQ
jgi:peptidoglycan/LPS O-acetylase OafA/YrhL